MPFSNHGGQVVRVVYDGSYIGSRPPGDKPIPTFGKTWQRLHAEADQEDIVVLDDIVLGFLPH